MVCEMKPLPLQITRGVKYYSDCIDTLLTEKIFWNSLSKDSESQVCLAIDHKSENLCHSEVYVLIQSGFSLIHLLITLFSCTRQESQNRLTDQLDPLEDSRCWICSFSKHNHESYFLGVEDIFFVVVIFIVISSSNVVIMAFFKL